MPMQMGYPDVGCQSCGAKAKAQPTVYAGHASGATEFGDSPVKDEYKASSQPAESK